MNKTLPIIFLLFILTGSQLQAQITFNKAYGSDSTEILTDVQVTSDSGYVIAGYSDSLGSNNQKGYVVKTDAHGDILWAHLYGCPGNDRINSIKQTADNGYIMTGQTTSFSAGDNDMYLIKTDSSGMTLWQRIFHEPGNEAGSEVRQTSDDGYIIVGNTDSLMGSNIKGIYIIKTSANGDSSWTRIYNGPSINTIDNGSSIFQTHDGGYIIAGSATQKDSSNTDVYLLKIDSSGQFEWNKFIGGPGNEGASAVHQTRDRGYIITGTTNSFGLGGLDFYMVKTDSTGAVQWSKTYGGGSTDEGGFGNEVGDGGYFIIGETGSYGPGVKSFLLVKTDGNGDTLWAKAYSSANDLNLGISAKSTNDGGFILAGWHAVFHGSGLDYYLIKTDVNGNSTSPSTDVHGAETTQTSWAVSGTVTVGSGSNVLRIDNAGCFPLSIVTNHATGGITLYPNPAGNELNVQCTMYDAQCKIVNTLGQTVFQSTIFNQQSAINISFLASGLYFLQITDNKESHTAKFIKE